VGRCSIGPVEGGYGECGTLSTTAESYHRYRVLLRTWLPRVGLIGWSRPDLTVTRRSPKMEEDTGKHWVEKTH